MKDRVLRANAILNTHSTAVSVKDGLGLDKDNNPVTLNESLITTEINRLQTEWNAKEYQRKRKAKYDALNQFELISDDAINGTTTHKDAIVAIKSEFPKP